MHKKSIHTHFIPGNTQHLQAAKLMTTKCMTFCHSR